MSIAKRVGDMRHAIIGRAIGQQLKRRSNDDKPVRTYDARAAGMDGFRPLRDPAKDEDRLAEGRRLFLDPSGNSVRINVARRMR